MISINTAEELSLYNLDGNTYNVRMAVRKKVGSNHFYIHHIDTEKSSELLSPSHETVDYEIQNS